MRQAGARPQLGVTAMPPARTDIKFTVNAAFFREIKEDHKHLQCLLEKIRQMVAVPPALPNHWKEFVTLLADLRDQLAFHFALEEAYGYFEDAIERAPRFHEVAGRLRNEHSDLYLSAERLADLAAAMTPSEAEQMVTLCQDFDTALKAHEAAELRLILDAIQQDVGVGD
jgi:hypothetical protein